MHTFEGLELNNLFFVLCDFWLFDICNVSWLSEIIGFLMIILFDFISLVLLLVIFNWVYTTHKRVGSKFLKFLKCGGVVVYWCIHSTLTLKARVRISPWPCPFTLQQGNLSTLLLSTQAYKWGPGRMWQIIVLEFASAIMAVSQAALGEENSPRERKLCTVSAELKCIQWPG